MIVQVRNMPFPLTGSYEKAAAEERQAGQITTGGRAKRPQLSHRWTTSW
jgi:hypothetical protein